MGRTIKLKKYEDIINEEEAASAITPGALIELTSAGTVQNHSTADGAAATILAVEDELQGGTIEDAYAEGDKVRAWYVQPGEEALVLIDSAFDPDVGAYLQSDGAGKLKAHDTGEAIFQVIGDKQIDDSDNHRVPVRRV